MKIRSYFKIILLLTGLLALATSPNSEASHIGIRSAASQAYAEDTNTMRFVTNDLNMIKDSIIYFEANFVGLPTGKKITVYITNPKVVGFKDDMNAESIKAVTGQVLELKPKGFGRSALVVVPKESPQFRQSFPVYVDDFNFSFADSVFNASIFPEGGLNFIEPQDVQSEGFLKSSHRFYVKSTYRGTKLAEVDWEVKNLGDEYLETRIALKPTRDTADIFFSKGGNYVIYLRHRNNKNKDIIDSLSFSVNLPHVLSANVKTGFLNNFIDERDGQLYNLLNVKHPTKERWVSITEPIRYLPHVSKLGEAAPGWDNSDYVFVFGNDTTVNPNLVRPHLRTDNSVVMYNLHMQAGTPVNQNVAGTNYGANVKVRGICPEGFYIPKSDSLVTYLFNNSGTNSSLRDAQNANFFCPANVQRNQTLGYAYVNRNPVNVETQSSANGTGVALHPINGRGNFEYLYIDAEGTTLFNGNENANVATALLCARYNISGE